MLDGNMKNSREVCYAIQVGHTEFNGLPGSFCLIVMTSMLLLVATM